MSGNIQFKQPRWKNQAEAGLDLTFLAGIILKPNQTIVIQQATVTNVSLHPCLMSLSVHSFSVIPSSIICLQRILAFLWIHSFIRLLVMYPRDIDWLYLANTRNIPQVAIFFSFKEIYQYHVVFHTKKPRDMTLFYFLLKKPWKSAKS